MKREMYRFPGGDDEDQDEDDDMDDMGNDPL